jgi:hypothetical protein
MDEEIIIFSENENYFMSVFVVKGWRTGQKVSPLQFFP